MIYRVDIIAQDAVAICEELLYQLNHALPSANSAREIIMRCLKECKNAFELKGFYLTKTQNGSFDIELYFPNYEEIIKVIVKSTQQEDGELLYKAQLSDSPMVISKHITTSNPLLDIGNLIYQSAYHDILYIDQFSGQVAIPTEDSFVKLSDFCNDNTTVFDTDKEEKLKAFSIRLNEEEKRRMRVSNINLNLLAEKDSLEYECVSDFISLNDTTCLVIPVFFVASRIMGVFPNIMVMTDKESLHPLPMEVLLRRIVAELKSYFSFGYSPYKMAQCINRCVRNFKIPKDIVGDVCIKELAETKYRNALNYLLLDGSSRRVLAMYERRNVLYGCVFSPPVTRVNEEGKACDKLLLHLTIDGTSYEEVEVEVTNPHKTIQEQIDSIIDVFELPKFYRDGTTPRQYLLGIFEDEEDRPIILGSKDENGIPQTLLDYNINDGDHLYLTELPLYGPAF